MMDSCAHAQCNPTCPHLIYFDSTDSQEWKGWQAAVIGKKKQKKDCPHREGELFVKSNFLLTFPKFWPAPLTFSRNAGPLKNLSLFLAEICKTRIRKTSDPFGP